MISSSNKPKDTDYSSKKDMSQMPTPNKRHDEKLVTITKCRSDDDKKVTLSMIKNRSKI